MKRGSWCVILSVVASTAVIAWMSQTRDFDPAPCLPIGFHSPILALELVENASDLARILGEPDSDTNRQVFRDQIFEDWFFIPSYSMAFIGLILVGYRKTPFAKGLALLALACVLTAATFDFWENQGILSAVNSERFDPSDAVALAIRSPSIVKWAAIFAESGLVALLLLTGPPGGALARWLARGVGTLLAASSVVGFLGLLKNPWIEQAVGLLGLGFTLAMILSVVLVGWPNAFSRAAAS